MMLKLEFEGIVLNPTRKWNTSRVLYMVNTILIHCFTTSNKCQFPFYKLPWQLFPKNNEAAWGRNNDKRLVTV